MASSSALLHLVAVGFHHRRGTIVEMAYPDFGYDDILDSVDNVNVPDQWKNLPSLALPDGAHNYMKDIVYFTLPSLDENGTVFGIASYRQIESSSLSNRPSEVTRNTVQKSLVVLSRVPLFSFIAHHLTQAADTLFQNGGFTSERLRDSFAYLEKRVNAVLNDPVLYKDAILFKLSASNFVRVYARNALILFKLLLLERRVLFAGESAGWISNWILTLLSLVPGLLSDGLSYCSIVDHTWLYDSSCWSYFSRTLPLSRSTDETSVSKPCFPSTSYSTQRELSPGYSDEPHFRTPKDNAIKRSSSDTIVGSTKTNSVNKMVPLPSVPYDAVIAELVERMACRQNPTGLSADPSSVVLDSSMPVQKSLLHTPASPFSTDYWGFPLALFTQSNILPIYASLCTLDTLLKPLPNVSDGSRSTPAIRDRCVRGFLAGATNPLLQTHKGLAEVVVHTLSPIDALAQTEDTGHSSLTSLFGSAIHTSTPRTTLNSDVTQSAGSKKRQFSVIHVCATSAEPESSPRATPRPLSQALQLSKMDRLFIDQLNRLVTIWYQARSVLNSYVQFSSSDELDEWICRSELIENYLDKLLPVQRTALLRFPSTTIFDSFIRRQFTNYLRALLLTTYGYGDGIPDFNGSYVECFRSTHAFQVWTRNFILEKAVLVSNPQSSSLNSEFAADLSWQHSAQIPLFTQHSDDLSVPSAPESVHTLFALHPSRRLAESGDWEQILDGVKRFRELAAEHGRRLFVQGAQSLNKLNTEITTSLRSSSSSAVISKFSNAFKSLMSSASPTTNL